MRVSSFHRKCRWSSDSGSPLQLFLEFLVSTSVFLIYHFCHDNPPHNPSKIQSYRYIFHDMKIRSIIVYYSKDPPKQMCVIVNILYCASAYDMCLYLFSSYIYFYSAQLKSASFLYDYVKNDNASGIILFRDNA